MKEASTTIQLVTDDFEAPSQKEKSDYSNIGYLEMPPKDDWFYETTGPKGEPVVYLRFHCTGLMNRVIGPYPSREVALWILDYIVNETLEGLIEASNGHEHIADVPFHSNGVNIVKIESPFPSQPEKGA